MNKLLIISYSYPPSQAPAAQRPFYLAKYLNKKKWKTYVVTPKFSDSSMGHESNPEILDNVDIHFTKNINISRLRGLKSVSKTTTNNSVKKIKLLSQLKSKIYKIISSVIIPDKGLLWIPFGIKKSFSLIKKEKIDVVFTTSPLFSNHLVGLFLKKTIKVSWVADFRDFHYIENYQNTKLFRKYIDRWIEKSVIKNADRVIFIADSMRDEYIINYPELKNKTLSVYNGFEPELNLKVALISKKEPLTIFYAGSFYAGERSPFPLLKLLDKMIEEKKISFKELKIKIAGNIEDEIKERMKKYNSSASIEFLGLIKRKEVLLEIRKSHLLWLIVGNTKNHYMGFPIKGYEYIAAQRNILAFVPENSESDKIISKYKLGYVLYNNQGADNQNNIEKINSIVNDYKKGIINKPLILDNQLLSLSKQKQFQKIEELLSSLL